MAEKNKNEILEAQRKAQQSFLELKKMQKGEMETGPKPSEVATVLKTPKEKFAHFWHYSKWYVIGIAILIAFIVFMVAQCASKPKYDLKVVYFTYSPAVDELIAPIAGYIEQYAEDINGDGKVKVQVINCSISDSPSAAANKNVTLQKLQSLLAAEESAVLFITDQRGDEYFENLSDEQNKFFSDRVELGEEFYKQAKADKKYGELPEGLTLSCRRIAKSTVEKNKDAAKCYETAMDVIDKIKKEQSK